MPTGYFVLYHGCLGRLQLKNLINFHFSKLLEFRGFPTDSIYTVHICMASSEQITHSQSQCTGIYRHKMSKLESLSKLILICLVIKHNRKKSKPIYSIESQHCISTCLGGINSCDSYLSTNQYHLEEHSPFSETPNPLISAEMLQSCIFHANQKLIFEVKKI